MGVALHPNVQPMRHFIIIGTFVKDCIDPCNFKAALGLFAPNQW